MRAIQITRFGGPEVLELADIPDPEPGPGETLIEVSRAGINYADTHQAENTYLAPSELPLVPGGEVVGTAGDGRRVVALVGSGGYAERATAGPETTFEVPGDVGDGEALALVLQGTTAWHLLRTSAHLGPGESVVVHSGAGGVGSLAVQLAKEWGAGRVIATASNEEKRALARELGADIAVDGSPDGLKERLIEANEGQKIDVVLEMSGGAVTDQSLRTLAPFGRMAFYGMASRELPESVSPASLLQRSQAVIGFWLAHCLTRPGMLAEAMTDLLALTAAGKLRPVVGGDYALSDARSAHEDLRSRRTVGKLVLDPAR